MIKEELIKLKQKGVTEKELADAKNNLTGHFVLSLEDISVWANMFAMGFWFQKEILTPQEQLKRIKAVKLSLVNRLAKELFDWDKMRLAVIGPVKKEVVVKMV